MTNIQKTLAVYHGSGQTRTYYKATLSNLDGPLLIYVRMWTPEMGPPVETDERHTSPAHTWDKLTNIDHEDRVQRTLLLEGSPFAADIHFDRIIPLIKGLIGPSPVEAQL